MPEHKIYAVKYAGLYDDYPLVAEGVTQLV